MLPTDRGEVWAYPDAGTTFARTGETWVDGSSYDHTLSPGRMSLTASRDGPWGGWIGKVTGYTDDPGQTATMKATRTSVRKGARIRLTGVVPTEGHWGSQAGIKKTVAVYAHRGKAAVPTAWDPRGKGWHRLASVRTNGFGAYRSPYFRLSYTCTLIVRYPGDGWYLDAYTSPRTVGVR